MEYASTIVGQVAIMFILILIGFGCRKTGFITNEGKKQMSSIVLGIVTPALIFMSYQSEFSAELLKGLLWAFALGITSFLIMIALSLLLVRKKEGREDAIERFGLAFTNCAFMGIPLINALFGEVGVLYATAYITLFNLLTWTYGLMLIRNEMSVSGLLGALKSPTIISIFLGIICYVTNIRLPKIPASALKFIADMNTPLAMLTAGATMAETDVLKAFKNPRTALLAFYRLILLPLICAAVLSFFPAPEEVYITIVVVCACPTATTLILFAVDNEKNDKYAAEIFSVTTLLSAVTMPLILTIVSLF